jgi:hypothetical protein
VAVKPDALVGGGRGLMRWWAAGAVAATASEYQALAVAMLRNGTRASPAGTATARASQGGRLLAERGALVTLLRLSWEVTAAGLPPRHLVLARGDE